MVTTSVRDAGVHVDVQSDDNEEAGVTLIMRMSTIRIMKPSYQLAEEPLTIAVTPCRTQWESG